MTGLLVALHLGGVPETAMFLGPILLIVAFVRIARRKEAGADEDDWDDDWDPDLGDLGQSDAHSADVGTNNSATSPRP
ncbi:hypothetical protein BWI15_07180 [Kribbella sp. ALI-6-A]|uniref:hypothetical protein n=1 Tax=Kribbella sp. ALI-6-A TaxID=1933817 RepID=UPI00097CA73F|nr:hypothetical protein [Kribbella sp. ALI-6-A]ONI75613.1 hypothetical protein BWI15_07180 [Kribbella sp. ALI-6-A]